MWNVGLVGAVVTASTALAAYNAYVIKEQFYPACMYLMKSPVSAAVLCSFVLYVMFLLVCAIKFILFGRLRLIESEHLQEYGWLTLSESFLAMTIFRDEFDAKFVFLFSLVLFIKAFHWIARDRIDYMEQTPMITQLFYLRMSATILLLLICDIVGLYLCIVDVVKNGPSMSILFGNEFALLIVSLNSIIVRYTMNAVDQHRGNQWEHRSIFLFYYEFVVDLLKLVIYSTFFAIVVAYYGVPLHIVRDLYLTIRSFIIRIRDIIRYRRATANMNEKYPEATTEELATTTDKTCIICREEMDRARKLPCGHLFHFRCLRSWLERQQACPTCRRPIFDGGEPVRPRNPQAANDRNDPAMEQNNANQQGPMIWRNGRWVVNGEENIDNDNNQGNNNAGPFDPPNGGDRPAVVFPPQVHPMMSTSITTPPALGQIPGVVIPSPFGTIPVILIPPEQIALVPRPQRQGQAAEQQQHPDHGLLPPRAARTPDPYNNRQNSARDTDDRFPLGEHQERLPQRSSSAAPDLSYQSNETKPLYILKTEHGPSGTTQHPIILESIEGDPTMNVVSNFNSISITSPMLPARSYPSDAANTSNWQEEVRNHDRKYNLSRASIRTQLRRELGTLTRLQEEITFLIEHIIEAQDRLDRIEQPNPLSTEAIAPSLTVANDGDTDDGEDADELGIILGKQRE